MTEMLWYVRPRRLLPLAAVAAALTLCTAFWSGTQVEIPGVNTLGTVTFPLAALLPAPYATLVALSLNSDMRTFDLAAARPLWRAEVVHVVIAGVIVITLQTAALALSGSPADIAVTAIRNVLFWLGVALVSGRLLGRPLSWVLPLALVVPLAPLSTDALGRPRWWAFPFQGPGSALPWVLSVVVLATGLWVCLTVPATRRAGRFPGSSNA